MSNPSSTDGKLRVKPLTPVQQAYIDWKALDGLIVDPTTGEFRKMPITELAKLCGVTVDALYKGKEYVPDFWDRVNKRRVELGNQERLGKFHQKWFAKALEMKNWPLSEAWIRNFDPNFKGASFKMEHDISDNMADLMRELREAKEQQQQPQPSPRVIEAQVTTHEPEQPHTPPIQPT